MRNSQGHRPHSGCVKRSKLRESVDYEVVQTSQREERRVVFILEIARGEEAKGKQCWEMGRRVLKQVVAANRDWADEYHLVDRTVAVHATNLY